MSNVFFKHDKRPFGRNCTDRLIKSISKSSLAKSRDQFLACGRFVLGSGVIKDPEYENVTAAVSRCVCVRAGVCVCASLSSLNE